MKTNCIQFITVSDKSKTIFIVKFRQYLTKEEPIAVGEKRNYTDSIILPAGKYSKNVDKRKMLVYNLRCRKSKDRGKPKMNRVNKLNRTTKTAETLGAVHTHTPVYQIN